MEFKIGDEVRIKKDSVYYNINSVMNPTNTRGIIDGVSHRFEYKYKVMWGNLAFNSYREIDLEFWGYPINALNKILYPEYVEENGRLVPRDI